MMSFSVLSSSSSSRAQEQTNKARLSPLATATPLIWKITPTREYVLSGVKSAFCGTEVGAVWMLRPTIAHFGPTPKTMNRAVGSEASVVARNRGLLAVTPVRLNMAYDCGE